MLKFNCVSILPVLCLIFLFGCCSVKNELGIENLPYMVEGKMEVDENSSDYEVAGLDLFFMNKKNLDVSQFTIVFYLFDSDGEPISGGKSNIVLTINEFVPAMTSLRCCMSLDSYFSIVPEFPYMVDYLYVSKIVYENGEVWSDPLGMCAF